MNYNYNEAVKNDVREYIEDHYTGEEIKEQLAENRDEWQEELYDDMFVCDSVTGNESGSYTFNSYKAEENLLHNLDLLGEAAEEFGNDMNILKQGAEACDVTIRCYLLYSCIDDILDELEQEYNI